MRKTTSGFFSFFFKVLYYFITFWVIINSEYLYLYSLVQLFAPNFVFFYVFLLWYLFYFRLLGYLLLNLVNQVFICLIVFWPILSLLSLFSLLFLFFLSLLFSKILKIISPIFHFLIDQPTTFFLLIVINLFLFFSKLQINFSFFIFSIKYINIQLSTQLFYTTSILEFL